MCYLNVCHPWFFHFVTVHIQVQGIGLNKLYFQLLAIVFKWIIFSATLAIVVKWILFSATLAIVFKFLLNQLDDTVIWWDLYIFSDMLWSIFGISIQWYAMIWSIFGISALSIHQLPTKGGGWARKKRCTFPLFHSPGSIVPGASFYRSFGSSLLTIKDLV